MTELRQVGETYVVHLFLVDPVSGVRTNLSGEDRLVEDGAPVWSPDGRRLAYHRFPLRGTEIVIAVWVMDVATGVQRLVAAPGQRPLWLE